MSNSIYNEIQRLVVARLDYAEAQRNSAVGEVVNMQMAVANRMGVTPTYILTSKYSAKDVAEHVNVSPMGLDYDTDGNSVFCMGVRFDLLVEGEQREIYVYAAVVLTWNPLTKKFSYLVEENGDVDRENPIAELSTFADKFIESIKAEAKSLPF